MTTPNFKLLLHALRLGQPPEPTSAIRALAEELAAQDEQFEELKKKLAVLGSHLQFVEARAARLEAAPQAYEGYAHDGYAHEGYVSTPSSSSASSRSAGQRAGGPQSAPPNSASAALEAYEASLAALSPHAPSAAAPDAPAPSRHHLHSAPPPALPVLQSEDSSDDEYKSETVVVNRRDIQALRGQEAPFRLPPPGARGAPEARRSIPGAPWARSGRAGQDAAGHVHEDHTVDIPGGREELDDPDDTFRERGGYSGERGAPGSDEPPPRRR